MGLLIIDKNKHWDKIRSRDPIERIDQKDYQELNAQVCNSESLHEAMKYC